MKTNWRTLACGLALIQFIGCVTPQNLQQKESLLVSAGFKAIPVNTPAEQQMLNTLPPDRPSAILRMGKVYFVFPDPSRKILYVGSNAQYLAYETKAQAVGLEPGGWDSAPQQNHGELQAG
jgi:hypothetical protein